MLRTVGPSQQATGLLGGWYSLCLGSSSFLFSFWSVERRLRDQDPGSQLRVIGVSGEHANWRKPDQPTGLIRIGGGGGGGGGGGDDLPT